MKQPVTDQELESRLAQAVSRSAPDDLEGVLSRCTVQKGAIPMENRKKRKWFHTGLIAACLALLLVGGGTGVFVHQTYAVASVVSLDVNPSIELKLNQKEKVLSCTPLNAEAAEVLFDMDGGADLEGAKADVAVNAIVGALVRNGYLSDLSSAILISVEDRDQSRAVRLQESLSGSVDSLLQTQAPNAVLLSQTLTADAGLGRQARQNRISAGRAALIQQVLSLNSTLSFDRLASLNVAELSQLLETGAPAMPIGMQAACLTVQEYAGTLALDSVTANVDPELDETPPRYEVELHTAWGDFDYQVDAYTGEVLSGQPDLLSASSGAGGPDLLTETQAFNAAAEHLAARYPDLNGYNILDITTKLGWDSGRQVYEVEFACGGAEFDYEIDAYTGAVLDWDSNYQGPPASNESGGTSGGSTTSSGGTSSTANPPASSGISLEDAKKIALDHAGLTESQITGMKAESGYDDGRLEYEIEFWAGNVEYEYTILGDGSILKQERDDHGASGGTGASYIGEAAAKTAALNHAGCLESATVYCSSWLDYDNGRPECYKVEFCVNGCEYAYEIGLYDGCILKHEYEACPNHHGAGQGQGHHGEAHHGGLRYGTASSADVGLDTAKQAALNHAGLSESQVYGLETKREYDDGRLEYEIEFKYGQTEYQYTVDGTSGSILDYEWDD